MADTTVKHSKANIYEFFFANKKRATYSNLAISLVLIMVFLVFALRPTILTIGSIKAKIQQYDDLNKKAEAKIRASKKLQDQMNLTSTDSADGLKTEIDFLNKVFLSDYSLKLLYTNVLQRAKDSNVAIRSIVPSYPGQQTTILSFDTSPESPSDTSYTLNISVEGKDVASVEGFIRSLEGPQNFPILSRVSSINVVNEAEAAKISEDNLEKTTAKVVVGNIQMNIYLDGTRFEESATPIR